MFGGSNNVNLGFPFLSEENLLQYCSNALPPLQLLSDFPSGCSFDPMNCTGNGHAAAMNHPIGSVPEAELVIEQQKPQICLNNNFHQDDHNHAGRISNQNPVSTGLKLSREEDKCNSSTSYANECIASALSSIFSGSGTLQNEIDHQKEEFDRHIKLQEANIMKGIKELQQRQTTALLHALEKSARRKIQEKELEIQSIILKNKEIGKRIEQVTFETQTWQHKARYNESIVNALKSNLCQVTARAAVQAREGCGESEVDDTASHTNPASTKALNCRSCRRKEVSFLLMPCRHLCLCKECEGSVNVCPVCQVMKTASLQVYLSW